VTRTSAQSRWWRSDCALASRSPRASARCPGTRAPTARFPISSDGIQLERKGIDASSPRWRNPGFTTVRQLPALLPALIRRFVVPADCFEEFRVLVFTRATLDR
jgi:hypothetical protein